MQEPKCFEISFPGVEFDKLYPWAKENVPEKLHAHLYDHEDEIELRILFDSKTHFGDKFGRWMTDIKFKKFGSYLQVHEVERNERLLKIDLCNSALLKSSFGGNQFEDGFEYVSIKLDTVKYYFKPRIEEPSNGEFYFTDAGFKMVEDYYAPLFGWDGEFKINRMDDMDSFYPIGKADFRPEFNFSYHDNKGHESVTINKEPKLNFTYREAVTEEEAILYGDIIALLSSFFFHTQIDYLIKKIYLPEHNIVIRKIHPKSCNVRKRNLSGFGIHGDFDEFLKKDWASKTFENKEKLIRIITQFNQSHVVDPYSKFMVRFNIIEVANTLSKNSTTKFNKIPDKQKRKQKEEEALSLVLETIDPNDHLDFTKKWKSCFDNHLIYRPMKEALVAFLEQEGLKVEEFPISFKRLTDIRNDIVHGSMEEVEPDELENANTLLYRLNGILILNLLGINEWKLDTKFY
jgi:hypothetical protein